MLEMKHQVASVCLISRGALKADLRCLRKRSIAENVCHLDPSASLELVSLRSEKLGPIAKATIARGSQVSDLAEGPSPEERTLLPLPALS